jgi:hypothetical protein
MVNEQGGCRLSCTSSATLNDERLQGSKLITLPVRWRFQSRTQLVSAIAVLPVLLIWVGSCGTEPRKGSHSYERLSQG